MCTDEKIGFLSGIIYAQSSCRNRKIVPKHAAECRMLTAFAKKLLFKHKNRISEKLQLVVITDDAGKPKVLLEVKEDSIVQAKLFNNVSVKNDIALNKLVLEFAEETRLDIETTDIQQSENDITEAIA